MEKLIEVLGKETLFFDGGTGTVLQSMGLKPGELPETWNIKHPEKIIELHKRYFEAGANIIKTNTFGCFTTKFPLDLEKIIKAAVENACKARDCAKVENFCGGAEDECSDSQDKCASGGVTGGVHPLEGVAEDGGAGWSEGKAFPTQKQNRYIAFDISSTGKLLKPMGDLDFEDAVTLYKKTFRIAFTCPIDAVLIETMNDGYETKAAVIAAKEVMEETGTELPILVTNVYDADCRTLSGSTPESMVCMLEALGVAAIGVNCSLGPLQMLPAVKRLCDAATVPVIVNPNAGLPKVVDGKTVFDVSAADFASAMKEIAAVSARGGKILGGCCGTTPEYIKKINNFATCVKNADENGGADYSNLETTKLSAISSNSRVVYFGKGKPAVLIGERINPTGKKKFKEALRAGDLPYIIRQGLDQEEAGAQVLDVNVGLPEIDEKQMMLSVMTELQAVTDLPLQIDTTNPQVMEAALRRYNGKAMINSVNGKQEIMDAIFPLVKKYGGLVVALTLDENGIPSDSKTRVEIAQKIYAEAAKYGISRRDIIIDPLAMAVSSDSKAGLATLETVGAVSAMGGLTSLGISNVSFGLPNREFVTSSFFTLAMERGLSAAIMNPLQAEMKKAYYTFNLLHGFDENCAEYINWSDSIIQGGGSLPLAAAAPVSPGSTAPSSATPSSGDTPQRPGSPLSAASSNGSASGSPLTAAIIKGLKADSAAATVELLQTTDSLKIINEHLIPGLDFVGKRFEEKTMYLPQLLMAAEAAKAAFAQIRSFMDKNGKRGEPKGKIIIATVKGDIHDIGKNIVKVLLENYDFEVIDLGKDVAPEVVVQACKKDKVLLVGLSALMTTTVAAMEETIKLLRKECPWAKVCVGGAVMTQEYADQIGADFYGKDAMDTVRYANKLFEA